MKIYTKKGDKGKTALIGGTRVSKAHIRIDAYGTVDELNSHIGVVQTYLDVHDKMHLLLADIQDQLFIMGSLLAEDPGKSRMELPELKADYVKYIEDAIDEMNQSLEPLKSFILPAGHIGVAQCHIARCVCRRAERTVVRIMEDNPLNPIVLEYLNRLSDFLFVLARKIGKDFGAQEVAWKPGNP